MSGIPESTLYRWLKGEEFESRRQDKAIGGRRLVKMDDTVLKRLKEKYETCHLRSKVMRNKKKNTDRSMEAS